VNLLSKRRESLKLCHTFAERIRTLHNAQCYHSDELMCGVLSREIRNVGRESWNTREVADEQTADLRNRLEAFEWRLIEEEIPIQDGGYLITDAEGFMLVAYYPSVRNKDSISSGTGRFSDNAHRVDEFTRSPRATGGNKG
jgi:hypothetical protein